MIEKVQNIRNEIKYDLMILYKFILKLNNSPNQNKTFKNNTASIP